MQTGMTCWSVMKILRKCFWNVSYSRVSIVGERPNTPAKSSVRPSTLCRLGWAAVVEDAVVPTGAVVKGKSVTKETEEQGTDTGLALISL